MAPARKIKKLKRGITRVKAAKRTHEPEERRSDIPPSPPPQPPAERPRKPTPALLDAICERLAGGQTGAEVCRDPAMPTWALLCTWRQKDAAFDKRYWVARKQGCEFHADEIITIADDGSNDYVERKLKDGGTRLIWDRESFERSRLRVDARKWTASRILRHLFGERAEVAVSTPDGVQLDVGIKQTLIDSIVALVRPKDDP